MKSLRKHTIFLLLIAVIGFQFVSSAHAIEHAVDHHDHQCVLYLASQENGHANLASLPSVLSVLPECFQYSQATSSITPVFHFNFFGRAPPAHSPA